LKKYYSNTYKKKYSSNSNAVFSLAPTRAAAILVDGRTIHSWIGIGATNDFSNINKLKSYPWKQAQVILIDEISMVSKELLDFMDKISRTFRNQPNQPFGGLQVIFFGDFLQSKPVKADLLFQIKCMERSH